MVGVLYPSVLIYIQNSFEYFNCIIKYVYTQNVHNSSYLFVPNCFPQSFYITNIAVNSFFRTCHKTLKARVISLLSYHQSPVYIGNFGRKRFFKHLSNAYVKFGFLIDCYRA